MDVKHIFFYLNSNAEYTFPFSIFGTIATTEIDGPMAVGNPVTMHLSETMRKEWKIVNRVPKNCEARSYPT